MVIEKSHSLQYQQNATATSQSAGQYKGLELPRTVADARQMDLWFHCLSISGAICHQMYGNNESCIVQPRQAGPKGQICTCTVMLPATGEVLWSNGEHIE